MEQVKQVYELEKRHMELQRREEDLKEALSQARYDHRQAKAAQLEYGAVRKLLDRFRGKQDRQEELLRAVRDTQGKLDWTEAELQRVMQAVADTRRELDSLPGPEAFPNNPEKYRLEALLCLSLLPQLLESCDQALEDHREMENEIKTMQIVDPQKIQAAATLPITRAAECRGWLSRLEKALTGLDISFALPPFYQNPDGFLAYATQYTRRDRINEALAQTQKLIRQIPELKKRINE